jgi:serine/threonine-protein kinase
MAVVWEARDLALGRRVAVKIPFGPVAGAGSDPRSTGAIVREARLAALVNHPGVTAVFDVGMANGRPFIVMELVEGPTLASVLRTGALHRVEIVHVAAAVTDALAAVHDRGVVHGDVKPANVILTPDLRPMLSDLGIGSFIGHEDPSGRTAPRPARGAGVAQAPPLRYGTVPYAAPEVVRGEAPTAASDVYALGVMLGEMGVGGQDAPEEVAKVCSATVAPDPGSRPSASSVASTLLAYDAVLDAAPRRGRSPAATAPFEAATAVVSPPFEAGSTEVLVANTSRLSGRAPSAPDHPRRRRVAVVAAICGVAIAAVLGLGGLTAGQHGARVGATVSPRSVSPGPRLSPTPAHAALSAPAPSPSPGHGHAQHHRHHHKHGHGVD